MKSIKIKETKTSTYATINHQQFWLREKGEFRLMSEIELERKTAYKNESGWVAIVAENLTQAWELYSNEKIEAKRKRKIDYAEFAKLENKRIADLLELDVIDLTVENLRLLMKHLNSKKWGSWSLPTLSVGYSANQYDCDGKQATTVILDQPLNGVTKFSIGAPKGHLEKYTPISRF